MSNMAALSREGSEQWPKWQTALLIGTPVALGLAGLWYYTSKKSAANKGKRDKSDKSDNKTISDATATNAVSDQVKAAQKPTSKADVELVCMLFVND